MVSRKLIFCALILIGNHCWAEGESPAEKVARAKAEAAIARILEAQEEVEGKQKSNQIAMEDSAKKGILNHFKIKSGIPFPKPEQVVLPKDEFFTDELTNKVVAGMIASQREKSNEPLTLPGRCRKGATERNAVDFGKTDRVIYDTLYLAKDMIPLEPSEVFGNTTELRVVDPDNEEDRMMLSALGIPCIPYRIRMTERFEFKSTGNEAYRNYDKEPAGPGKLHPWAAAKIGN